jgi:AbrB family looped-hinge helix DNA binding protein
MMDPREGRPTIVGLGRVQARGQVTVPVEVRQALDLRPGDVLLFEVTGDSEGRFRVFRAHRELDRLFAEHHLEGTPDLDAWDAPAEQVCRDVLGTHHEGALKEVAAATDAHPTA